MTVNTLSTLFVLLLLHSARALPLVSFFSASEPTLGLRHCAGSVYATTRTWTDADLAWEPMNALDGNSSHISLRSMNFPGSYLCSGGANNTLLAIDPASSTNARCSFRLVSGLSDPRGVSLEQGGSYVTLSSGLIGACATNYPTIVPSGSHDVVLVPQSATATPAAATWYKADASTFRLFSGELALRHCLGLLYANTASTDSYPEDFAFVFAPALNTSSGVDAVSLRSFNFPSLHIGLLSTSTWRVGAKACTGAESDCTFTREALSNGQLRLKHEPSGRYIALDTNVSGGCSWNQLDVVLDPANGTLTKAFNAWQWFQPVSVSSVVANLSTHQHAGSSLLYGLFFEEMNFGGDGGIYAEQIWNGDFQAQGRGELGDGQSSSTPWVPIPSDYRPWSASVVSGAAVVATSSTTQPYSANEYVLSIIAENASSVSLSNPGFWGINVLPTLNFTGKFYARTSAAVSAEVSIKNNGTLVTTKATIQLSGDSWNLYTFAISATTTSLKASFNIVLSLPANTTLYLDGFSMFPSDAISGLFRKDLFNMMKELNPAFFRFPGGNFLEGYASWTRWDWKKTVGTRTSRPGHYNDAWGYWSSDGLGYYEYLLLCEALETEPQLSIFTGYYLGRNYVSINESSQIIQDAVDAMDFANADVNTTYGQLRASMGHPAPFNLKRLEVGNEETNMSEYKLHYDAITQAIWAKYPNTEIVGSGWWSSTPSVDLTGNPCISGSKCDAWDEHYYMYPDVMALTYQNKYDSYPRSSPKVFVGEYSANLGDTPTLRAALAEASFMTGFERNVDVVVQSAFCPLFGRIGGSVRNYNMINYNSAAAFPIPSYYVQKLFRETQPEYTFSSTFSGVANAAVGTPTPGIVVVKIVNYGTSPALVEIVLKGINASNIVQEAELTTYLADWGTPGIENSIDTPNAVVPQKSTISVSGDFKLWVSSYSLAVVKITVPDLVSSSSSNVIVEPVSSSPAIVSSETLVIPSSTAASTAASHSAEASIVASVPMESKTASAGASSKNVESVQESSVSPKLQSDSEATATSTATIAALHFVLTLASFAISNL